MAICTVIRLTSAPVTVSATDMEKAFAKNPEQKLEEDNEAREAAGKEPKEPKDETEKAEDTGDDEAPEFDEDEYEDTPEMKQCKEMILAAYGAWLAGKKDETAEPPKDMPWAKPESGERPKDFAKRVAAELAKTEHGKASIESFEGEEGFADWVEAVMKYEGPDAQETAKSLESVGYFNVDLDSMEKAVKEDYLSTDELVDVMRAMMVAGARRYAYNPEAAHGAVDSTAEVISPSPVAKMCPADYVNNEVYEFVRHLTWGDSYYTRIMHKLGSIDAYIAFVKTTIWTTLIECGVVESIPVHA